MLDYEALGARPRSAPSETSPPNRLASTRAPLVDQFQPQPPPVRRAKRQRVHQHLALDFPRESPPPRRPRPRTPRTRTRRPRAPPPTAARPPPRSPPRDLPRSRARGRIETRETARDSPSLRARTASRRRTENTGTPPTFAASRAPRTRDRARRTTPDGSAGAVDVVPTRRAPPWRSIYRARIARRASRCDDDDDARASIAARAPIDGARVDARARSTRRRSTRSRSIDRETGARGRRDPNLAIESLARRRPTASRHCLRTRESPRRSPG